MAEAVVDRLEVVEVEDREHRGVTTGGAAVDHGPETRQERVAQHEARHRIARRTLAELDLLDHAGSELDEELDLPFRVAARGCDPAR